jgi:hypothetical protein
MPGGYWYRVWEGGGAREGGRVEGSVKKYVAKPLQITRKKKMKNSDTLTNNTNEFWEKKTDTHW